MNDQLDRYDTYVTRIITLRQSTLALLHMLALAQQESLSAVIERLAREEARRKEASA